MCKSEIFFNLLVLTERETEVPRERILGDFRDMESTDAYFAQVSAQTIAPVNAALGDLSARLSKIECNQPEVAKVPYSPVVGIPTCVAAQYGLGYGFNPYAAGNGFWG